MANEVVQAPQDDFDWLRGLVTEGMARLHIPGVAVGVIYGDQQIAAGFGVTNVDHPLPVTPGTFFQIGSITKTFTGTLMMRLVEQGRVDLDAPLRTYLPELRLSDEAAAQRVTARHLLTHTGGWPGDYFFDGGRGDDALVNFMARMVDVPIHTPLGEIFAYNNAGFNLAARVIEVVTGQTYERALQELILDPLGLTQTFLFPEDVMTYRFASGHDVGDQGAVVTRPWAVARATHGVGGILTNVFDLLRYARFHMSDGATSTGTMQPETVRAMREPQVSGGSYTDYMGITWFINDVGGIRTFGHGGATNGQMALLRFVPEQQFALVVLTNSENGSQLYRELLGKAYVHFLDARSWPLAHETREEAALEEYAGRYEAVLDDVTVTVRDGGLVVAYYHKGGFPTTDYVIVPEKPSYEARMAFVGRDQLVGVERPILDNRFDFLRDAGGKIVWFRYGGRLHRRVETSAPHS